jgi:hypothetical protein
MTLAPQLKPTNCCLIFRMKQVFQFWIETAADQTKPQRFARAAIALALLARSKRVSGLAMPYRS